MSEYEQYIQRLCRTGKYTPEEARKLAVSHEVKKYYEKENPERSGDCSTYTLSGECK